MGLTSPSDLELPKGGWAEWIGYDDMMMSKYDDMTICFVILITICNGGVGGMYRVGGTM